METHWNSMKPHLIPLKPIKQLNPHGGVPFAQWGSFWEKRLTKTMEATLQGPMRPEKTEPGGFTIWNVWPISSPSAESGMLGATLFVCFLVAGWATYSSEKSWTSSVGMKKNPNWMEK